MYYPYYTVCFFCRSMWKKTLILYLKVTGEDGKKKKKEKKATEMMAFDIYYLSSPDAGLWISSTIVAFDIGVSFSKEPWIRGRKSITDFWKHQFADRERIKQNPYDLLVLGMWSFWLFFQMHVNFNLPSFFLNEGCRPRSTDLTILRSWPFWDD